MTYEEVYRRMLDNLPMGKPPVNIYSSPVNIIKWSYYKPRSRTHYHAARPGRVWK